MTPVSSTYVGPVRPVVPASIQRAIRLSGAKYYRALDLPLDTYADQAARASSLAAACAERASCWAALAWWAGSTSGAEVQWPLLSAVLAAQRREDDAARFWQDTAMYWRRAAAGADPRDLDAEYMGLDDERGWRAS
jgi:hypothetical protein